jgi:predicted NAD/FAD-binding protein
MRAAQVLRPEAAAKYEHMSLGEFLKEGGYSGVFTSHYLLPMCAAVWSVPNAQVCARTHHHYLA